MERLLSQDNALSVLIDALSLDRSLCSRICEQNLTRRGNIGYASSICSSTKLQQKRGHWKKQLLKIWKRPLGHLRIKAIKVQSPCDVAALVDDLILFAVANRSEIQTE